MLSPLPIGGKGLRAQFPLLLACRAGAWRRRVRGEGEESKCSQSTEQSALGSDCVRWRKSPFSMLRMEQFFADRGGKFAVESVFWRRVIDWSVEHIPAIFHRPLIWIAASLFFFLAAPARKGLLRNLRLVRPRS